MPHKCTQCGREFKDGSTEILNGCPSCGGKKFLYINPENLHRDVLEEKSIEEIAAETGQEIIEIKEPEEKRNTDSKDSVENENRKNRKKIELYDRVESIRVLNPGTYELNLEKLASSDGMVMKMGTDGKYVVDIMSMSKSKKKKKK
ncbi:Zn-ribbon domain-containing protein [Methanoplanus endosymbiosus]|uniref:Zn-ribbon domain-containing protein n=1 Tax=Methanoplanus endosymbiosus TaxID=33865 RepID=A0A9E7PP68_9EURY|nr:Zn-ribbon domain-containing protein [Methanoplanus endosymbiosus]UUX93848.1 Zn-ribbon domain-containing protein [Methanoplanus endosymbiosus]